MDKSTDKSKNSKNNIADSQAKIKESASQLLHEGKKLASEMYHQGVHTVGDKITDVENGVHEYSDKLIKKIHDHPLSSVLIAAGVGMLISSFLKK